MSRLNLVLSLFVAVVLIQKVGAEMHSFSLEDGRALEAEIVDYNAKLGKVTLKRPDGKRIPVQADIFVSADRAYIKEWDASKAFTSESLLKVVCKAEMIKKSKEEIYKDIRDSEGNVEEYLMKEIKYEEIAYTLSFMNRNKADLDGIRIEYRIYYEQSSENRDKAVPDQYVLAGRANLPVLIGGKKTLFTSNPSTVYTDNINSIDWADGSARVGGKGDVHGIRARLFLKNASGSEIMREVVYPTTLSANKFPWKEGTGKPRTAVGSKR
jgi:hypothetical protein